MNHPLQHVRLAGIMLLVIFIGYTYLASAVGGGVSIPGLRGHAVPIMQVER